MQSLNHHYRTIWSEALGAWIAVSEITKAKGKRSASSLIRSIRIDNSCRELSRSNTRLKPILFAVACCFSINALANPVGGTVVNGHATFATIGNTLTVTNTPGTIINWQNFSINANEITNFAQQSAASSVLNRVTSANPSNILGSLQSNGRVFLVNPNGIVFGAGSTVDVGGLVATTLKLSNADFLAGNQHYSSTSSAQNISNSGNISAHDGGQIYLIAPNVENNGIITAPNGEILLAAGNSVDLVSTTNPNLRVNITAPAGNVTNVGQLVASAGSLGLFGTIVQSTGVVNADSAVLQGGKIVFKSSQTTLISGTVSANGTTGGTIEALGPQVGVMDGAVVSANGTQGGGTVLIGGDAHGANPNVPDAQQAYVAPTASISANALQNGNGGKVVVWSDIATQYYGNISAQGGIASGNGGWVETSGKQTLDFSGMVNTSAPMGTVGTLLLDPTDITIVHAAAGTGTNMSCAGGGSCTTPSGGPFTNTSLSTASTLNDGTINAQLALNSVTISATNDIVLNSGAVITWGAGNRSLTFLSSAGSISDSATSITNSGTGSLNMTAYATLGVYGTITSTNAGAINLTTTGPSGWIREVGPAGTIITNGILTTVNSSTSGTYLNNGGLNQIATLNATDVGYVDIQNGSALTLANIAAGGGASISNSGGITITGTISGLSGSAISLIESSGSITESGAGLINTTGTLTTSSATGQTLIGANSVGTFNATNGSSNGSIQFTNTSSPLVITGISNAYGGGGFGFITVTNTGSIDITGTIATTGGNGVNLTENAGAITESGAGLINTSGGMLTTSSMTGTSLTGANTVASFSASNNGASGNIDLTNTAATLTITNGIINPVGNIIVNNSGAISVTNLINAGTGSVSLAGTGVTNSSTIEGGGGVSINAGTGVLSNTGTITNLGTSSPINLTANTITLSAGSVSAASGPVNLATFTNSLSTASLPFTGLSTIVTTGILGLSAGSGGINVNSPLTSTSLATSSTIAGYSLTSTNGTITETGAGAITGVSLTTSSVGGTTLTGANTISSFNATNSGGGAINLINSGPLLTITGISQSGGGVVSVTNTGSLSTSGLITSDGNVSLIAPGTSSDITVNGGINYTGTSTAGTLMIQAGRNISVFTAPLQSTGAQALNVTLDSSYGGTVGAVGLFSGGNIFSNGGNITIGGGSGTISAGVGFAQGYNGVFVDGSASGNGVDVRANLNAAGGNIVINGIADTSGSAFNPIGVSIGGVVSTTGSGTITLTGQSTSPTNSPYGVEIGNAGTGEKTVNGSVTSVNGDILINGISGSTTQHGNIGLLLINNSTVQSTGTGNITLNGTAASTAPTTLGGGIDIQSYSGNPSVLTNSGNIVITSSTGSGMSLSNTTITSTSGNVTLTSNGGTISQTAGSISGRTLTTSSSGGTTLRGANSVASYIASNSVSGDITLTNAYNQFTLDTILNTGAAGNVVIDNTGGVIVAGALTTPGYLDLTAHSPITIASTGSINAGGAVSLVAGSPGSTSPADTITINGTIIGSTVTLAAHEVSGNIPANAIIDVYNGTAAIAPTVLDTLASVVAMLLNPSEFNLLLEGGSANDLSLLSLDEKKEAAANLAANDKLNNKFDSFTVKALPVCK